MSKTHFPQKNGFWYTIRTSREFWNAFFHKKTSFLKRSHSHLSNKTKIKKKYSISKKLCPSEKSLKTPFFSGGHNFFDTEYFFLIFVLFERWEWDLFKNDVFLLKNAFQNSLPVPYQNSLFVENAFLPQNRDFHGNSTDIESKIPLEYRCNQSEMIPLWFLNAKTTSPSPRECIWVVIGTEIDISAPTRNWGVLARRDTFKALESWSG